MTALWLLFAAEASVPMVVRDAQPRLFVLIVIAVAVTPWWCATTCASTATTGRRPGL